MYSLTVCFGPANTLWTFLFKEADKPNAIKEAYRKGVEPEDNHAIIVEDDFGRSAIFDCRGMSGVVIEEMELAQLADVERGLHQARTQAKANTRAMGDEVLKSAARLQNQGPAVLQPGGMNGRHM
jgi:hypothetical protein